ncbi:MAG: class I SAM-dependent methyltransferase [Acidiferrobacteraceae bacterium]
MPSKEEQATSAKLAARITHEIEESGGVIDFARFMELSLYAPGLGYYVNAARAEGITRDFVTAPDLSPLFGGCLANFCRPALEELGGGSIIEIGAGSGALAIALLGALRQEGPLPERYLIHEVSPALRALQERQIAQVLPELLPRVEWIDEIPSGIRGVILANELLDALPCARFTVQGGSPRRLGISATPVGFTWNIGELLPQALTRLGGMGSEDYTSELGLAAEAWIGETAARLEAGALLIIDYGFPRHEYYHPDRAGGTLMCHYRHRAHDNPLIFPGLQDITAHLDFTALAEAAASAGLRVHGYTHQAAFLLDCGLMSQLERETDERERRRRVYETKILTLPSEMGELFKALACTRGLARPLPGFGLLDLLSRL